MPSAQPIAQRLLVVSHPSVVPENQAVYLALMTLGWSVQIVIPSDWPHEYSGSSPHGALPGLEGHIHPVRVGLSGRAQRHFYLASPKRLLRELEPEAVFIEQEPFAVSALQWGFAARRAGLRFGVQAAENLDRRMPLAARMIRSWVLPRAAFVAARSPRAGERALSWGATGTVAVVPHAVPGWSQTSRRVGNLFTIGFAGRLVTEKGVVDLLEAVRMLDRPARLLIVGEGPERTNLERACIPGVRIEVVGGRRHDEMPSVYEQMDVLVVPSRTTRQWAEQFGRVLVEALWCGTPVVGSSSGEIPWVISATGGGEIYAEGDINALAGVLRELHDRPDERRRLATRGTAAAMSLFSPSAAAQALDDLLRTA